MRTVRQKYILKIVINSNVCEEKSIKQIRGKIAVWKGD